MNYWTNHHFFQIWRTTQNRLLKMLFTSNPLDILADNDRWHQSYLKDLASFSGSSVNNALQMQTDWLEQWLSKAQLPDIDNSTIEQLTNEANETVQQWVETQQELWEHWFKMLRDNNLSATTPDSFSNATQTWECAIKQILAEQAKLTDQWHEQNRMEPITPEAFQEFSGRFQDTMENWLGTQKQLWNYWLNPLPHDPTAEKDVEAPAPQAKNTPKDDSLKGDPLRPTANTTAQSEKNDLTVISGIGPALEKKLNSQGICNYQQLAGLDTDQIAHLESTVIKFPGRIQRDRWIEQAKELL